MATLKNEIKLFFSSEKQKFFPKNDPIFFCFLRVKVPAINQIHITYFIFNVNIFLRYEYKYGN